MKVWLQLGRVSNLPTVWTNTLAGITLAGGLAHGGDGNPLAAAPLTVLLVAMSAAYVGGMFLNDAFDREIDATERPERPIPSGQVTAKSVFFAGFSLLSISVALTVLAAALAGRSSLIAPLAAALALAGVIVAYDYHHKNNPLSPLVMGMARVGVYACAAVTVTEAPSSALYWGMLTLLGYLIGLTYVAKQESFNRIGSYWPLLFLASPFAFVSLLEVPLARGCYLALLAWVGWALYAVMGPRRQVGVGVGRFIAGICLLDAMWIAGSGNVGWVVACLVAFVATRLAQRVIAGT